MPTETKAHPATLNRLNKQSTYSRRLREYGSACRTQSTGAYVDHVLAELKMALFDLIEAAKQEGAVLWIEQNAT